MVNNTMRLCLVLAAAAVSCGGTTAGINAGCTVTLSGAATGTYSCGTNGLVVLSASNVSEVGMGLSAQPAGGLITIVVQHGGLLSAATYTQAETGIASIISYQTLSNGAQWGVATGGTNGGTYTMTISSLGTPVVAGATTSYPSAQGTLDAALAPVANTPATGTITLHATF